LKQRLEPGPRKRIERGVYTLVCSEKTPDPLPTPSPFTSQAGSD
jgi:hypothetical protein